MFEPGPGMDLDEDDVRIRPNPKGSKPRTKRRPTHENALMGMVIEVHLARYKVLTDDGREVLATLAKELRNKGCVTCDRVALAGEVSDEKGALARIVRIEPRSSELTRSSDESDVGDQTIVANADQLAIVMASANPEPKPRLVDRYLVAAMHAGLKPILIMTKCDLADPKEFISGFEGFDLKVIRHSKANPDLEELEALLARGGVIGGSSAGATIQGSYLVRGSPRDNRIMMSPGHEEGFGFLRASAIDQHVDTRGRADDLRPVLRAHPALLGVGLDEATAIIVRGDEAEVAGRGRARFFAAPEAAAHVLRAGERFDLGARRPSAASR